jgi:PadR family transcriptional regulator
MAPHLAPVRSGPGPRSLRSTEMLVTAAAVTVVSVERHGCQEVVGPTELSGTSVRIPYVDDKQTLCRCRNIEIMQDLDITPKMAMVLKVFLEDLDQPRYGFELMKLTGMASGSLYPMLARLEAAGWLTRGKEDIDPHTAGRPPRTNYTITGAAVSAARVQLAELSERYRPPASRPLRPQGSTS